MAHNNKLKLAIILQAEIYLTRGSRLDDKDDCYDHYDDLIMYFDTAMIIIIIIMVINMMIMMIKSSS